MTGEAMVLSASSSLSLNERLPKSFRTHTLTSRPRARADLCCSLPCLGAAGIYAIEMQDNVNKTMLSGYYF